VLFCQGLKYADIPHDLDCSPEVAELYWLEGLATYCLACGLQRFEKGDWQQTAWLADYRVWWDRP